MLFVMVLVVRIVVSIMAVAIMIVMILASLMSLVIILVSIMSTGVCAVVVLILGTLLFTLLGVVVVMNLKWHLYVLQYPSSYIYICIAADVNVSLYNSGRICIYIYYIYVSTFNSIDIKYCSNYGKLTNHHCKSNWPRGARKISCYSGFHDVHVCCCHSDHYGHHDVYHNHRCAGHCNTNTLCEFIWSCHSRVDIRINWLDRLESSTFHDHYINISTI